MSNNKLSLSWCIKNNENGIFYQIYIPIYIAARFGPFFGNSKIKIQKIIHYCRTRIYEKEQISGQKS